MRDKYLLQTFCWCAKNFSQIGADRIVNSPRFEFNGDEFMLRLYPALTNTIGQTGAFLVWCSNDKPKSNPVCFSIAILHPNDPSMSTGASTVIVSEGKMIGRTFDLKANDFGWAYLTSHAEAMQHYRTEDDSVIIQVTLCTDPEENIRLWTKPDLDRTWLGDEYVNPAVTKPVVKSSDFLSEMLYQMRLMYDTKVIIGSDEFRCHKAVLSLRSEYFRSKIVSGHTAKENDITILNIDSLGISKEVFEAILLYLYRGELAKTSIDQLMVAASKLKINTLFEQIQFDVCHVLNILDTALMINQKATIKTASEYITRHYKKIDTKAFLTVSFDCILTIVKQFIHSQLSSESVDDLLQYRSGIPKFATDIIYWIDADFDARKQCISQLVQTEYFGVTISGPSRGNVLMLQGRLLEIAGSLYSDTE